MMPSFVLPFADTEPTFAGPLAFAGPRSAVLGRATIGTQAWLGEDAVVRADGEVVRIGDRVHLGRRATVHIVHELLPAIVGDDVTVGANAIVHACTVGDRCVIEHDVTVLDGAEIASDVLIEPCSTVFPRKKLEGGWIYAGSPAKPVRALKDGELAARAAALRAHQESETVPSRSVTTLGESVFLASTASVVGRVEFAANASLFFSCVADAGSDGSIVVGENTNVQDNTILRPGSGEIVIGAGVTVGHNVQMGAVRIGAASLIGMGAKLADGTTIGDDVLLAAGATTEAGQVLESGWMWGGRPAKAMSKLDDARRAGMRENVQHYLDYARTYRQLQIERFGER